MAVGRGVGLRFAGTYFPSANHEIRIATSYFRLGAYNLGRRFVHKNTRINVLVGQEQGEQLRKAVVREIESIIEDVKHELGMTLVPLMDAIEELIDRMRSGKFLFHGAYEMAPDEKKKWRRFHCKFYIVDSTIMWSGSANFTENGLSHHGNDEQLEASHDPNKISLYNEFFIQQIHSAKNLLQDLLSLLEQWRDMRDPFEAYLKAMVCMFSPEERFPVKKPAHKPTYYQEGIIVQAVKQVQQYRGTLVLVATGLGKTVIGAEVVRRLTLEGGRSLFYELTVVAPKATITSWKNEISGRGCSAGYFDNSTMFRSMAESENSDTQVAQLDARIDRCDENSIFIFDEAHRYRKIMFNDAHTKKQNQKRSKEEQQNYQAIDRIDQIIKQGGKVILLTATPYSTQKQDINSLFRMLPPFTSDKGGDIEGSQVKIVEENSKAHWEVKNIKDVVTQPIVTVLGMTHVLQLARDRNDIDEDGRLFLQMRDGIKLYLPKKINFHRVSYVLFLQEEMARLYEEGMFDGQMLPYPRYRQDSNDIEMGAANTWRNNILHAWTGSPLELERALKMFKDELDDEAGFKKKQAQRRQAIEPLLALISSPDKKLEALLGLLLRHYAKSEKIIVFVERRATAVYLQQQLSSKFERVGCTAFREEGKELYSLLSDEKRKGLIHRFAPIANSHVKVRPNTQVNPLDILILTDADGIGINMQDASVVVNYDLPQTVDELFQRAGRILRPVSDRDREAHIYSFVPIIPNQKGKAASAIQAATTKLFDRQDQANIVFNGGKILFADDESNTITLSLENAADLDNFFDRYRIGEDRLQQSASGLSRHTSIFERYEEQAIQLQKINVQSAKKVKSSLVKNDCICLFLQGPRGIECVLFDLKTNRIIPCKIEDALNLLECQPNTQKDAVSVNLVEEAAICVLKEVLLREGDLENSTNYERICTVYLRPEQEQETGRAINNILQE